MRIDNVVRLSLCLLFAAVFLGAGLAMPMTSLGQEPTQSDVITDTTTITDMASLTTTVPVSPTVSPCPQGCLEELPGCDIKGNISADGEHIYHVPGCSHYKRTKIDSSAGERWFCSTADARANGWRPCNDSP